MEKTNPLCENDLMQVKLNKGFLWSAFIVSYASFLGKDAVSMYSSFHSLTESAEPDANSFLRSIKVRQQMIFVWSTVNLCMIFPVYTSQTII